MLVSEHCAPASRRGNDGGRANRAMKTSEQVIAAWNNTTKTIDVETVAKQFGFMWFEKLPPSTRIYHFPDNSRLVVRGRGATHSIKAE